MNPTNESIGRAFRESIIIGFDRHVAAKVWIINRARELDRQAPGDDHVVYVTRESLQYLRDNPRGHILAFANANPNFVPVSTRDADLSPQPPAQEQGEAAWQVRWKVDGVWNVWMDCTSWDERKPISGADATEYRPLYTSAAGAEDAREKYEQLIYAVESKYPGESRHETALRFIREREIDKSAAIASQAKEGAMADHVDALQNIRLGIEMDRHCLDDADERLAALAQQAGADYKHVATISQTKFGSYWIDWHEKVAYRKGLKLFASSGAGGGGEGG